ncbi:MAG: histidine kinase, partial [Acidobacteriota bacterium]
GLLKRRGLMGNLLQLVEALEAADWNQQEQVALRLGLAEDQMAPIYRESMEWSQDLMARMAAA